MREFIDVQLGDVVYDFGSPFVTVGIARLSTCLSEDHYVIGVPEHRWSENRFLTRSSVPSSICNYMRDVMDHEDNCTLAVMRPDIDDVFPIRTVDVGIAGDFRRAVRETMSVGSSHTLNGYDFPHFVDGQFLTIDAKGKPGIYIACSTNKGIHTTAKMLPLHEFMKEAKIPMAGIHYPGVTPKAGMQ